MSTATTKVAYPVPGAAEAKLFEDPTRARYPDATGHVERDGVRVFWESYGEGDTTFLMFPAWALATSRIWKNQIAFLARRHRVIVFDPRGNGGSDRPEDPALYAPLHHVEDALAMLDANGVEKAITVSLSAGTIPNLGMCALHPERVEKAIFLGSLYPVCDPFPGWMQTDVTAERESYDGWDRYNVHAIHEDLAGFAAWWGEVCLPEPHSTVQMDFGVARALQSTPDAIAHTLALPEGMRSMEDLLRASAPLFRDWAGQVSCETLVVNGSLDAVTPPHWGEALARDTGARLVTMEGSGHLMQGRAPVALNLVLREFVEGTPVRPDPVAHRPNGRRRVLYVSSPIGLGHARRDLAIARELRTLVPGLEVQWLTQDPVTRMLREEGESVHPASEHLASESGHFESESAEHDLHCFQTWRRMSEVLANNFMVYQELMEAERFDLVIADEGWDVDYFLHEHPRLKRAPYAWLTDFVGMLPMEDGGEREAYLSADHNGQMVDHIAEHPHVRDRSIFVGNPEDVVTTPLGPGLPAIRDWTEEHFDFAGYVTGFEPRDRTALRTELGYGDDERVCVVTVGGSGVGGDLLRRVIAAQPAARDAVPGLRTIVVAGPRIDPATLPAAEGVEVHAYVPGLYRHLAACDLAVVQGGLTTAMELTANRRPFLYFPLKHHFEQRHHVAHRLDRYGAGRRMEFDDSPPEDIADAIAAELGREVDYRPVETDGARRAAGRLAELL
ncbi:MAG TPA: alpha/beta fold hydrolase [Solirubrobacteraceae bacterium]|nr:alpha/beta fold hydrolase [Solirubrobacteraceae bacterium]